MPRPYSNSPARIARLKAQRLAMRPYRRVARLHLWTTPTMIAEVETERAMYAVRPSRNEVANQLLQEGLI
jgi:hypothetical protein